MIKNNTGRIDKKMIDELIQTGERLENESKVALHKKYFKSVNFEEWVSKSILYLESEHKNSELKVKAQEGYKNLNQNNSYDYYLSLLGILKASKDIKIRQSEAAQGILDLNDIE